ncbi:Nose resistant to fluoxetine protein 6 [Trichinella patagoniensis]|uniref:Nose resistant to fluoxetine protein 6 n=1 Tax=Trichinella patagoniensis TaxID=990121 RepID=A0A0V1A946_9BILA|nr:Nose resistant to fluoxetine protein 6 [Trichinella patagoniensis]
MGVDIKRAESVALQNCYFPMNVFTVVRQLFHICILLSILWKCYSTNNLIPEDALKAEDLLYPSAKSLPVDVNFVLQLAEQMTSINGSVCAELYDQSLKHLFGHDVEKASLFKAFFSSFVVTSTLDNVTLEHWKMMERDFQCKMIKLKYDNHTTSTQYCTYSITSNEENSLEDGIMYGFCLPSECTNGDIIEIVKGLESYRPLNGSVENRDLICVPGYQPIQWWKFWSVHAALACIGLLTIAVIFGTIADVGKCTTQKQFLRHFSILQNFRRLWYLSNNQANSITCIHGIKVITMSMIMLTHLICFLQSMINNIDELRKDYKASFFAQFLYNGTYRVATFFVISGALFSYSLLSRAKKRRRSDCSTFQDGTITFSSRRQSMNITFCLLSILNRYLRLLPVYFFTIILVVGFLPHFSDFPSWYVVDPLRQCQGEWWKNLLYINNLQHKQLCMTWTWYLASDFQLFLFHFPLVLLLISWPKLANIVMVVFLIASCLIKAILVNTYDYPPSLMLMIPIPGYNPDFASYTFDIYMRPYGWWGSYLVGLYFGYILSEWKRICTRKLYYNLAIIAGVLLNFSCICGIYWNVNGLKNQVYDMLYAGVSPVIWGLGWVLIIGACHSKQDNWLNRILSHPFWVPLSNLTYSCYLIHCIVIFAVIEPYARMNNNLPFLPTYSHLETCSLYLLSFALSYFCAAILFLLVEAPADSIRTQLFRRLIGGNSRSEQFNDKNATSAETVPLPDGVLHIKPENVALQTDQS